MCCPEDPLFTPLLSLARVPFQAKESVHKNPFWENLEILASTASIFTQILVHKPPNLEIFSSQASKFGNFPLTSPPFQRQMSVRKPHTLEIRAAHPYLKKKVSAPPPPGAMSWIFFKVNARKLCQVITYCVARVFYFTSVFPTSIGYAKTVAMKWAIVKQPSICSDLISLKWIKKRQNWEIHTLLSMSHCGVCSYIWYRHGMYKTVSNKWAIVKLILYFSWLNSKTCQIWKTLNFLYICCIPYNKILQQFFFFRILSNYDEVMCNALIWGSHFYMLKSSFGVIFAYKG